MLRDAGANVILTRADDNFIPVNERPRIANRAGADFFLCVHADSGDSNHSANGSTVFFHAADPNCRTLARCIADRFEQMGGIRSRGTEIQAVERSQWRIQRAVERHAGFALLLVQALAFELDRQAVENLAR